MEQDQQIERPAACVREGGKWVVKVYGTTVLSHTTQQANMEAIVADINVAFKREHERRALSKVPEEEIIR